MQPKLILVTGANGFVGRHLCRHLADKGYRVRGTVRANPPEAKPGIEYVASGDLSGDVDWRRILEGVDAVVHAAARVHVPRDRSAEPMKDYRDINVTASEALARKCTEAGVRRFVFLSSIKASDVERNPGGSGHAPYEVTKFEAEKALGRIAQESGLELVVLRPPLVYGSDAVANFALLSRAVAKGLPLPLRSIRNRRSFVYVGNLCSAIAACLEHAQAPGGTFEVSDGPPLSTPDFVRAIGRALDRPARLLPCPPAFLRSLGRALGRGPAMDSLTGDLVANTAPIQARLGWTAPLSLDEALAATFATREPGIA